MKKGACHSLANVNIIFYCAKWKKRWRWSNSAQELLDN